MSKVENILDGWKSYLIPMQRAKLDEAKRRAKICSECPDAKHGSHTAVLPDYSVKEIQGHYCGVCKCPLSTAVRSKNYECPKNKW